jgi:hypothetical protein
LLAIVIYSGSLLLLSAYGTISFRVPNELLLLDIDLDIADIVTHYDIGAPLK